MIGKREQFTTSTVKSSDVCTRWTEIVDEVLTGGKRVMIEEGGRPVAALVPARDLEWLKRLEAQREEDFKALDRTRAAFQDVPDDEIQREVDRAIAEIRAENRRRARRASA